MEAYDAMTAESYDEGYPELNQKEYAFYKQYLQTLPAPALEIGSGTGRLQLPYLKEGFEVEGVEPSSYMIDILQQKAAAENLSPVVYQQFMQTLELPKKYGLIYVPLFTFQYIEEWEDVRKAIRKFYDYLLPGGMVCIALHLPTIVSQRNMPQQDWQRIHERKSKDGKEITTFVKTSSDHLNQKMSIEYRYEIKKSGEKFETLNNRAMRWYSPHEIELLLEVHGFTDISVEDGKDTSPPMMANVVTMLAKGKRP